MSGDALQAVGQVYGFVAVTPEEMPLCHLLTTCDHGGVLLSLERADGAEGDEAVMLPDAVSHAPAGLARFAAALITGAKDAQRRAEPWRETA